MQTLFKKTDLPIKGGALLKPLIELRGRQCECCKNTTWLNQPINLQVHHIDGDRSNNVLENLQLLCLNCHSYTDNFNIKKSKLNISEKEFVQALQTSSSIRQALLKLNLSDAGSNYTRARQICQKYNIIFDCKARQENYCKRCGISITPEATYCVSCNTFLSRVVERPTRDILKQKIRNFPFVKIAQEYGVSDKAVVKWCIAENLPHRKKDIKLYSDEDWDKV